MWSRKADSAASTPPQEGSSRRVDRAFDSFIHSWISFNGWASCCLEEERDLRMVRILSTEGELATLFDAMAEASPAYSAAVARFRAQWPIFRSLDVQGAQLPGETRRERTQRYAYTLPDAQRAPDCHLRHPHGVPGNWGHTLFALYRVRCNLFHGKKSVDGPEDREIVGAAAGVLTPLVRRLTRPSP